MSHIRIEEEGDICGPKTRVFFIASDGMETDISEVCTAVRYEGKIGEANRATLELIKVRTSVREPLVEVVVRDFKRKRFWRFWREINVTTMGQRWRLYR